MSVKWNETTEQTFYDMLGVLPPAAQGGTGFMVGEAVNHRNGRPTFEAYKEQDGKFFVSDEAMTFAEFKAEFPGAEYYYDG